MTFDWHRLVSAPARTATLAAVFEAEAAPALVSGLILSALQAPVLEMPAVRAAALMGYFRACRQQSAVAVVAVEAATRHASALAGHRALGGIAAAAAAARHDGPIVVVARAARPTRGPRASASAGVDAMGPIEGQIAGDIAAGFSVVGFPAELVVGDRDALAALLSMAEDHGVGVDLELDVGDDVDRVLQTIDDVRRREPGLIRPVVRGPGLVEAPGDIRRVVDLADVARIRRPLPPGSRVTIDAITAAITAPSTTDDDVEVRTWLEVSRLLRTLGAGGTTDQLEALATARTDVARGDP